MEDVTMSKLSRREVTLAQLATPLIEPCPVLDTFCSGMAAIEPIGGGCVRVYLYANQTGMVLGGEPERVVVLRVVMPLEALAAAHELVHHALTVDRPRLAS
jgi:hypothetical protein